MKSPVADAAPPPRSLNPFRGLTRAHWTKVGLLFTWFFLIPGVLLVLIAGYGLWTGRAEATHTAHHARPTPA